MTDQAYKLYLKLLTEGTGPIERAQRDLSAAFHQVKVYKPAMGHMQTQQQLGGQYLLNPSNEK